jgi:hypothetical protein
VRQFFKPEISPHSIISFPSSFNKTFILFAMPLIPNTKRKASVLQDIAPEVDPLLSIQELFIFSPFGLCCRQCKNNVTIQLDERCIARHLKKHGMDSRVATVRSLFLAFKSQLEFAKALGTIDSYRSDKITYIGYSCICGVVFQFRKDNALRHCKKMGCDASKLQELELIKLCCGRYVSQSQVTALFNEQKPLSIERPDIMNPVVVVGQQDILPRVPTLASIRELFFFSPFGLRCRQCNKAATILLDVRSIYNHMKKHGMNTTKSYVRSFLEGFNKEISNAKVSRSIEPYRSDEKTYIGYSCICGQVFPRRKDNALRHCKKVGCDSSKLQVVELIKLCCGRYVSQAQVASFFNEEALRKRP